jgi:WD40 repeat protein
MLWVFLIGLVLAGAEVPKGGKEVKKEKEEGVKMIQGGRVNALVLGFDNRTVFAASDDGFGRYFDLKEAKLVNEVYHGTLINCMVLAKHGMVLYTGGSDGYVRAWLLRDQELITTMVVSERVFALATDGDHLWVGGKARIITKFGVQKKISFSKTECCPEVAKWEDIDELIFSMAVYDNYLYVGTSKGNVYLFDKESPAPPLASYSHGSRVNGLQVRRDGMLFSAGGGHVQALELQGAAGEQSFKEVATFTHASDAHMLHALVVSPAANNRIFSAGADGVVKVWEMGKKEPVASIDTGARIFSLSVCGNGTTVLAGSMDGKIWAIDWAEPDANGMFTPRALFHGYTLHIRDRKQDAKLKEEHEQKEKKEKAHAEL